jgi:copper chaperone
MIKLQVGGMTCDGGARTIERVLKARDPAAKVTVDFRNGQVEAQTTLPVAALVEAMRAAGYETEAAV